jgi:hypothetical protein
MPDPTPTSGQPTEIGARLHALAERLRKAHHLGPDVQQALAEVVEELSRALEHTPLPADEAAHLADSAGHLSEALAQQHDATALGAARDRLLEAAVTAETRAPVTAGLLRQIADALSNIGI